MAMIKNVYFMNFIFIANSVWFSFYSSVFEEMQFYVTNDPKEYL